MNTDITQTLCKTLKVLSNAIAKTKNELKLKPIVRTSPFSSGEQNTVYIDKSNYLHRRRIHEIKRE